MNSAKHTENSASHVVQRWRGRPGRSPHVLLRRRGRSGRNSSRRGPRNPLTVVDRLTIRTRGPRGHVACGRHRMSALGMAGSVVRTDPLSTNLALLYCTYTRHNVSNTTFLNTPGTGTSSQSSHHCNRSIHSSSIQQKSNVSVNK